MGSSQGEYGMTSQLSSEPAVPVGEITNYYEGSLTKLQPLANAALIALKDCSSDGGVGRQVRPAIVIR